MTTQTPGNHAQSSLTLAELRALLRLWNDAEWQRAERSRQ